MFNEILHKLRIEKGVSQLIVAEYLGVTKQAYSLYELGKRNPDNEMLYKISDYFDVSIDYLLGKSNIKNSSLTSDELHLLSNYRTLDDIDKAEIRGEMKQMLKADKYSLANKEAERKSAEASRYDRLEIAAYGGEGNKSPKKRHRETT